jgi:hypothetical protein
MACAVVATLAITAASGTGDQADVLFLEEFDSLDKWRPLHFPKIKEHSTYTVESSGDERYLKAESNASASGILYKKEFDIYEFPRLKWRWKVANVYEKGDAKKKSGDDYPLRVYVVFKYDPKEAGWWERRRYGTAKLLYGEYPPHSSLNYIWANKQHEGTVIINSYADEARMIPIQQGPANVGKWIAEVVNVLDDYQKAFGEKPPRVASIAIMNDSDNTGERSVSYIDYIQVYR